MERTKISTRATAMSALISMLIIALIANPARYIQSVYGGLVLFATNVLPALFPFFFFSKALTAMGCVGLISIYCKKPFRLLYNAPPCSAYIFIMSLLSGYPIGAGLCSSLYSVGEIDTDDVKSIMSFTSTSGPLFIIGTVASGMFKRIDIGYIILIAHYLGAILNGLLYRRKKIPVSQSNNTNSAYNSSPINLDNALSEIATSSVQSILLVGTYIAIFSMVIDFLVDVKVIPTITTWLNIVGVPREVGNGIIMSLVEVTRGILLLSTSSISLKITVPITCALISFGGLAITLQSLSFLGKCKIKASYYFLTKTTQAIISGAICGILCLIFI